MRVRWYKEDKAWLEGLPQRLRAAREREDEGGDSDSDSGSDSSDYSSNSC